MVMVTDWRFLIAHTNLQTKHSSLFLIANSSTGDKIHWIIYNRQPWNWLNSSFDKCNHGQSHTIFPTQCLENLHQLHSNTSISLCIDIRALASYSLTQFKFNGSYTYWSLASISTATFSLCRSEFWKFFNRKMALSPEPISIDWCPWRLQWLNWYFNFHSVWNLERHIGQSLHSPLPFFFLLKTRLIFVFSNNFQIELGSLVGS